MLKFHCVLQCQNLKSGTRTRTCSIVFAFQTEITEMQNTLTGHRIGSGINFTRPGAALPFTRRVCLQPFKLFKVTA